MVSPRKYCAGLKAFLRKSGQGKKYLEIDVSFALAYWYSSSPLVIDGTAIGNSVNHRFSPVVVDPRKFARLLLKRGFGQACIESDLNVSKYKLAFFLGKILADD